MDNIPSIIFSFDNNDVIDRFWDGILEIPNMKGATINMTMAESSNSACVYCKNYSVCTRNGPISDCKNMSRFQGRKVYFCLK